MALIDDRPSAVEARPIVAERTILDVFRDHVEQRGDHVALRYRTADGWAPITWAEYGDEVEAIAAGLVTLGLEHGDRVGLLSANQPRWHMADLAILSAAGITVPLYSTSSSSQVTYILRHSRSKVCFVQDRDQLAKVLLRRHELPDLQHAIVFGAISDGLDDPFVIGIDDLIERGRERLARKPDVVSDRRAEVSGGEVATVVYTSGTTGPPKGTLITHANISWTLASVTSIVPIGPGDRFLSFLPLSHIAERLVSHFGEIVSGGETWFARSLTSVPEDLAACRPTIFFAVPRVWQKFHDAILERFATMPRPLGRLFERYLESGTAVTEARRARRRPPLADLAVHAALDRTLGKRLRTELGLDAARVLVSSAAPIHPDTLVFFHAIGLPIAEVWGQTEDCGPATINPPDDIRIGTVGPPMPGLELRVADDGEILVRGGSVCAGYFEDQAGTAALIDAEGWMHTGDTGVIDGDGYLTINGRKKDLIITSSGKNIAPQSIESRLETEPLLAKAVVVGEGRPYLTALVTLDSEAVTHWAEEHGHLTGFEALSTDTDLLDEIAAAIRASNQSRSRIEAIKRFRVLPHEFTVTSGELTPTLKVKRGVVVERYADVIDELYAGVGTEVGSAA